LFGGAELIARKLDSFRFRPRDETVSDLKYDESIVRAYLLWAPNNRISLVREYFFESIESDTNLAPIDITTNQIPLQLSYFHPNGAFVKLKPTLVKQKVESDTQGSGNSNFIITDIETGYRFANKHGSIRLGIKNLFDESFQYRDSLFRSSDLEIARFKPERMGYLQFTLAY
jgi:outer membrane receptor protein involved in Fe transport